MLKRVSDTFHGRDVFAPVAAHLSLGLNPAVLGKQIDDPVLLTGMKPLIRGRTLKGSVIRLDRFGNALSNITIDTFREFTKGRRFEIRLRDMRFGKLSRSYYEGDYTCVVGSSGYIEFGRFKGNLAKDKSIKKGDAVTVSVSGR